MTEKTAEELFNEGERFYSERRYKKAAKLLRKAAKRGHAVAQFRLGTMHFHGFWCSQSYPKTIKWWRKAAKQGLGCAQYNLGLLYESGRIVERDYCEADKWHRLAAEQGDMGAQRAIEKIEEKVTNP